MTTETKHETQADAVRRGAQRLVNAVQTQRNAALDREAELMAALAAAGERAVAQDAEIGRLKAELEKLQGDLAAAKGGNA